MFWGDGDAGDGVVFGVAGDLDLGGDAFFEHLDVADDADAAAAHLVEAVERFHHVVEVAGTQRAEALVDEDGIYIKDFARQAGEGQRQCQ